MLNVFKEHGLNPADQDTIKRIKDIFEHNLKKALSGFVYDCNLGHLGSIEQPTWTINITYMDNTKKDVALCFSSGVELYSITNAFKYHTRDFKTILSPQKGMVIKDVWTPTKARLQDTVKRLEKWIIEVKKPNIRYTVVRDKDQEVSYATAIGAAEKAIDYINKFVPEVDSFMTAPNVKKLFQVMKKGEILSTLGRIIGNRNNRK